MNRTVTAEKHVAEMLKALKVWKVRCVCCGAFLYRKPDDVRFYTKPGSAWEVVPMFCIRCRKCGEENLVYAE